MAPKSKSRGRSKGKKGKKDPLTDEEKKAKAEQKARAEQEKRVQRQRLTKAFLDIKRRKEYELIKANNAKLLDYWRPIMRKQKIKELMEDYKMMQRAFERAYDKKSAIIQDLEDSMEKNEGEYDNAVDMHMYNIDKMMEFLRGRMKGVMDSYTVQKEKLVNSLNEERTYIQNSHEKDMDGLNTSIGKSKQEFDGAEREAQVDLRMSEEIIRNQATQELSSFYYKTDAKINHYWKEITELIHNFTHTNNRKRKEYAPFLERDIIMSNTLDSYYEQLEVLKGGLETLRERSEVFARAFIKYIEDLKEKRAECRSEYEAHMIAHNQITRVSRAALRQVAFSAQGTVDTLDEHLVNRERILKSVERCRKLERVEEKVTPFSTLFNAKLWKTKDLPDPTMPCRIYSGTNLRLDEYEGEGRDSITALMKKSLPKICRGHGDGGCDPELCTCCRGGTCDGDEFSEDDDGEADPNEKLNPNIRMLVSTYKLLERFWLRYNRADLERQSLKSERDMLMRDNKMLRLALTTYLGGLNPVGLDPIKFSDEIVVKSKFYSVAQCFKEPTFRFCFAVLGHLMKLKGPWSKDKGYGPKMAVTESEWLLGIIESESDELLSTTLNKDAQNSYLTSVQRTGVKAGRRATL